MEEKSGRVKSAPEKVNVKHNALKCSRFIRMENVRRLAEIHAACGESWEGRKLREIFRKNLVELSRMEF
jgi:hypothetical protein